jgi:hypothetical protein
MTKLQTILIVLNQLLEHCPKCGSLELNNKSAEDYIAGQTPVSCNSCSDSWTDSQILADKESIADFLIENDLPEEAEFLTSINDSAYRRILEDYLDISLTSH